MVVIYAVSEERCNEVESLVFDLFANLGATGAIDMGSWKVEWFFTCLLCDFHQLYQWPGRKLMYIFWQSFLEEQLDFPVLYASAKEGWTSTTFTKDPPADARNMSELLDAIIKHVPPPTASIDAPFKMLVGI